MSEPPRPQQAVKKLVLENSIEIIIVYWGNIGIMANKMEATIVGLYMGGPFWGTLNIRCRILIRIQKGTIILTTTHLQDSSSGTR